MKMMNGGESGREMKKKKKSSIFPTEDEITVAQILLDFNLTPRFPLIDYLPDHSNWQRKKRRSCLDPIPPLPPVQNQIKAEPAAAAAKGGGDHRTTTSPDTPFLFPPTHQKLNRSSSKERDSLFVQKKKNSDRIAKLTQQKCFLGMEIENVKNYCANLKANNSELKNIKQEVTGGKKVEIGITHYQPFVADPTAQEIQFPIGPITAHSRPSINGLESVNRVGPIGFDLNLPVEEPFDDSQVVNELQPLDVNKLQPFDVKQARYAEARRMRKEIMKKKSIKNGV